MIYKLIILIFLSVIAGNAHAVYSFYSTQSAAIAARNSAAVGAYGTGNTTVSNVYDTGASMNNYCNSPSAYDYYYYPAYSTPGIHFYACVAGFKSCPGGQTRNTLGACIDPPCVSPLVPANTVLPTTQTTCVPPDSKTCTSIGVDVNAFVAKCSQMLSGSPTQCYNSDITPFALSACPSLTCPDGSTTVYPTPCPVTSCPEGFTLSDVSGVGKTCVMPLPDDELQNPCVNVSGSDVPLCAEDGKNCQMVNGTFVCLKEEITPPSDSTCYSINSKNYCLSNQPTIETEKTTTTNPDGSTTVKEIMTPSINGVPARVKETTTHPDGSVTIISNNPGDLTDLGLQPQLTPKIDLSKVEKNTKDTADNTKSLLDLMTGFFDLPSDVAALDESPIEFPGLQTAIDSDLSAFEGFVNEPNPMKAYYDSNPFAAAFTSMLPSDTSCGYVLETSIFGKSFRLAPCEKLEPLREILAWFFSILTAWQIVNITAKSIVRF